MFAAEQQERPMSFQPRTPPIPQNLFASEVLPRTSMRQRIALTFVLWGQRTEMRRRLAEMDARSLRDAGISPAAAAYESGKPFWVCMGSLR
jgi:uncharacterized protein YjiS (DUF1127 family)